MIPIKDNNPRVKIPIITVLLIITNFIVFILFVLEAQSKQMQLINQYALFPVQVKSFIFGSGINLNNNFWMDFITCMFMHGSWMHLIFNCWFLWIFGDNVEGVLGHIGYLLFYLIFGIFASLVHIIITNTPNIPIIGASGAIAGVMGAYLILFPRAKVLTLTPFIFVWLIHIPAFILLIIWFIGQFLSGMSALDIKGNAGGGIAFWAHIGGFVIGVVCGILFRDKKERIYRRKNIVY